MNLISPSVTIFSAYLYLSIVCTILYFCGFYKNNSFFTWGPPITFFTKNIDTQTEFYMLHFLIFTHQIINNWVNNVVYPWIINSVQDHKNRKMEYSNNYSLFLINLFDIYSEVDVILIIGGFMSQISFFFTINIANILSGTFINFRHLKNKHNPENLYTEIV